MSAMFPSSQRSATPLEKPPPPSCRRPSTPPPSSTSQQTATWTCTNLLFGIGVFIVLLFFCFQLILGLIRREPQALSRAALGAGKAVLGSSLVITLTATALEIVDQLSIGIVQAAGETTGTMGDKITLLAAGLTAITQVATPIEADLSAVTEPITGIVLLFIAAFAPTWSTGSSPSSASTSTTRWALSRKPRAHSTSPSQSHRNRNPMG